MHKILGSCNRLATSYTLYMSIRKFRAYTVCMALLLGTNCTGELFLGIVRWTRHSPAFCFYMVEQGTVNMGSTPWYGIWVLVDTLKHGAKMKRYRASVGFGHEVARVP